MSLNYKHGKCLEPGCDEPAEEHNLFCKKHSGSPENVQIQSTEPKFVSELSVGQSAYTSPAFCFYLVGGQIYIGSNFQVSSQPTIVNSVKITKLADGSYGINPENLREIMLWTTTFVMDNFVKVTLLV